MASLLYQLVTIITVVVVTFQVLEVNGQNIGNDEENTENSVIQKLLNALIKYRAAQKEGKFALKEDIDTEFSDYGYDDDRRSRSNFKTDGDHLCMAVKKRVLNLDTNEITYKPSVLEEFRCESVHETNYQSVIQQNRMLCYVRGNNCENSNKIIPVSVYKREAGKHCWISETMNISVGCNCHFPTQHLGYEPYRSGR